MSKPAFFGAPKGAQGGGKVIAAGTINVETSNVDRMENTIAGATAAAADVRPQLAVTNKNNPGTAAAARGAGAGVDMPRGADADVKNMSDAEDVEMPDAGTRNPADAEPLLHKRPRLLRSPDALRGSPDVAVFINVFVDMWSCCERQNTFVGILFGATEQEDLRRHSQCYYVWLGVKYLLLFIRSS